MTGKHRKGKGSHKHGEDNFLRNDATETEARGGGGGHAPPHLVLLATVLLGAAAAGGAWFCLQQQQSLAQLTDSLAGVQVKMARLQSSHEEVRQSSGKHLSESLGTRLSALEESYATAQKQVGVALATAEQLRTSDLPARVASLHTEMKSRLAEMQQATVSLEQLGQLQAALREKSEEFEGVKTRVEGLASHGAELSRKVETLARSVGQAEARLAPAGQLPALSAAVEGQATELGLLKERLDSHQARLEERTLEVAALREALERGESQRLQQASVEEQISSLRQSMQDQTSAAKSATAGLVAQLEDVHKQIAELVGKTQPLAELEDEPEEGTTAPAVQEEVEMEEVEAAPTTEGEELGAPPADLNEEAIPEVEAAEPTPVKEEKDEEEVEKEMEKEEEEVEEKDQIEPDGLDAAEEEEEEERVEEVAQTEGSQEDVQEEPTAGEEPEVEEQVDAATGEESNGKEETPEGDREEGGEVNEEAEERDVLDSAGEEHAAPAEQEASEGDDDSGEDEE